MTVVVVAASARRVGAGAAGVEAVCTMGGLSASLSINLSLPPSLPLSLSPSLPACAPRVPRAMMLRYSFPETLRAPHPARSWLRLALDRQSLREICACVRALSRPSFPTPQHRNDGNK